MNLKDITKAAEKIGCLSVTTLDGGIMHSRIISLCGGDDEGLYFLTMDVKPFYRQLIANPQVSMCGIYPTSRKEGKNSDGQPYFPPGYTLRITGEAREVSMDELREKAEAGMRIDPEKCIACGECFEACTFKAIVPGDVYRVDGSRCDECGSCVLACPVEAIALSQTI
ncbi:4Fe-4S binding protein [Maridesulfovibrio sp.]|uniref:4Fe-4S binding protein n=1 Tax=Maridesulfovibrio sp. TaxID=2795000 RepID=UPI002A1889BB|nr:4Fe-4S binding protein [Maridesulfovibrio sp.]